MFLHFFCIIFSQIDGCWRLWVVDSGQVNSLQLCPPQIMTFDLVKDELIQRHSLPPEQVRYTILNNFLFLFYHNL